MHRQTRVSLRTATGHLWHSRTVKRRLPASRGGRTLTARPLHSRQASLQTSPPTYRRRVLPPVRQQVPCPHLKIVRRRLLTEAPHRLRPARASALRILPPLPHSSLAVRWRLLTEAPHRLRPARASALLRILPPLPRSSLVVRWRLLTEAPHRLRPARASALRILP